MSDPITDKIIGAAIEVHRHLGPGLLESVYEDCLARELADAGIPFTRQVAVPVNYKGQILDTGFRADLIIEDQVIVELKAVEALTKLHQAQLLSYLKLSGLKTGLLLNFNVTILKDGIKRLVA